MIFRTAGVSPAHDHEAGRRPAVRKIMTRHWSGAPEVGLVKGAPKAVQALRIDPTWLNRPTTHLWRVVSQSQTKAPNNQIDVVFELWRNELITQEPVPE